MSVVVSGPHRGEMKIDTTGLDSTERKALERNIHQRSYKARVMQYYRCMVVIVDVGTLGTTDVRAALEKIHASINQMVKHKLDQKNRVTATA